MDKLPTNLYDDPYNLYCLFSPDFESHIDIDPIEKSFVIRDSDKGVIYHKIPSTYLSFDINKHDEIKLQTKFMAWIDVEVDKDGKVVQQREVEENKGDGKIKHRSYAMALIDVNA